MEAKGSTFLSFMSAAFSHLSVRLLSLLQVLSALSTQNFRTRQIHVLYGALLLRLCVLQAKLSA